MAVASTRRTLSGILLLTLVAALAGACSPPNGVGTGGPEDTATPDVRIDAEIQDPDIVGEETPTEDLVIPPDGDEDSEVTEECPESKCLIGKVSCPTATIALTCEPVDDKSCPGVGAWDAGETCPAGSTCMENQGCTCQLGSCTGEDLESCLSPDGLKACQEWACQDGCCVVQDMEDCCATASDCEDGDLCTQDLCDQESHTCQFKSKLEMGLCDDGDSCTVDGCDSETGICTHELDTGTGCVVFCYGSTATLAVETHCGIDPCAEPQCMFEGPFVPWDEAYAPDCDGADADSCGVCDFSTPKSCDDGDPCTIDGCTPQEGCTHELDTQNPACFCVTTADCLPLIDGTCQTVSCLVSQQVCVKKPKDCEDGHPCTIDFCDEETNQCVHNLDEQNPECEGLELCYGQAWCDGYLVEKYGEGCACKAASCSLVTGTDYGVCVEQDTGCDDQDPCTADFCGFDGQVCGCDHAPVDCDDGDPCTADQCSPVQGCIHPPLDVNDGNPCTADSCNPNSPLTGYQVHTPVVCAEKPCKVGQCNTSTGLCNYTAKSCEEVPADPCTVDTCNQSTGLCVHTPKVCNDYNKCTVDFCNPGTGDCDTQPVDCNDNNPCTDDICNEVTGSCMHPPTYVNDFNACTLDSCKPSTGPVYEPVDCTDCVHPVTKETIACPGGNGPPGFQPEICTSDLCAPMSGCYHVPIMNVAAGCGGCLDEDTGVLQHEKCEDGNLCTADQCACTKWNPLNPTQCMEAACVSTPKQCPCPGDCAVCACDPFTGECDTVPGNCTDCIHLLSGATTLCPGAPPPGYVKNLCTVDSCDMQTGSCTHASVTCFDNNLCTDDICVSSSGCSFPPRDCDDELACTGDSCQPGAGCLHQEDCDDDDDCTVDSCSSLPPYACQFLAVNCDDGNPCTTDSCGPAGVCLHNPVTCNDKNPCTIDSCNPLTGNPQQGYCVFTPKACNDQNPCTVDICHPMNGTCYFQEVSCADCYNPVTQEEAECPGMPPEGFVKNLCTQDYTQLQGGQCVCQHTPLNPADQSLCTTDLCDPEVGIVNEELECVDDGNPCTVETCNADSGLCSSKLIQCPSDGNSCTQDVPEAYVDPELGPACKCVNKPLDCNDNNACTTDGTVVNGGLCSCTHVPVVCEDDEDPCTTDLCKIDEGCVHLPPECEDGNVCTHDWCDPELAEISSDPDVYCIHDEKSCVDCMNPDTGAVIQNCIDMPEGYVWNECTQGDYCDLAKGGCQYPTVTACPPDGNLCTLEYCNPVTGTCASDPINCDDGNVCTIDSCQAGQCKKTPKPGAQCTSPDGCNDGNPCTLDVCATTGNCTCSHPPVNCDDGDCCTVDSCGQNGQCVHTPVYPGCQTCADDPDCLVECPVNPFTGIQVAPDDPETGLCDPNTQVIINQNNQVVTFRDACNRWTCDPDAGQGCGDGVGQCVNTAVNCDDGDDCTLDFCDEETGCFTEPNPACCTPESDPPLMDGDPGFDPESSVCWDNNPCTRDLCDYQTGECSHEDVDCDDGNVCTVDACIDGQGCANTWQPGCEYVCYNDYDCSVLAGAGSDTLGLCSTDRCTFSVDPLGTCYHDGTVCMGGPACTEGVCDPEGGCSFRPLGAACAEPCATAADCDDGWKCSSEVCNAGVCKVTVKACNDLDPCTLDYCNPANGLCTYKDIAGCQSNCATQGGDAKCNDGNPCTLDWCSTAMGQCMYAAKTCDDGDPCTLDVCDHEEGCLFFPLVPCEPCAGDGDCDDGNPCTADLCKAANPLQETDPVYLGEGSHPDRYCAHESICAVCDAQVDCDAYKVGHPCVTAATCVIAEGLCDITFKDCDDGDVCTADECNPFTGQCLSTPVEGCCADDADCAASIPCHVSTCDPELHVCVELPSLCDDFDPCTADSCDLVKGCQHTALAGCTNECEKPQDCAAQGFGPSTCTVAVCAVNAQTGLGTCSGEPLACNDGNPCTVDVCVPLLGCQYFLTDPGCTFTCATTADCDDGNPCSTETCNPVTLKCQYSLKSCSDGSACTRDWCNPVDGTCTHEACAGCTCTSGCFQNANCNDGNPCTLDICTAGVCSHAVLGCFDGDPCTDDDCDPVEGCLFQAVPSCTGCTDDLSCEDGNFCTTDLCNDQYCFYADLCSL